jgi:LCP family protein required for cell wall assembly
LLRTVLVALLAIFVLYLVLPFWTTRTVILGSDARPEDEGYSRSDTVLVAAAGWQDGALSVPRDSLVEIPGYGQDKVNAALAYGGPDLTVQTLEQFTGVGIGDYVLIRFDGVKDIVNAMGGITINVEQPIDVGVGGQNFRIDPGRQELNGGEALAYTRYRGGPSADIGRIQRQQKLMGAAVIQMLSPLKWPRIPLVAVAAARNTETNMNPLQMSRFAVQSLFASGAGVETYPGSPQYINGTSYWIPDTESGEEVMGKTIK